MTSSERESRPKISQYVQRTLPIDSELRVLFPDDGRLTILDVGACEGEDSIRYQRRFPNATVYAFEPLPANAARARQNFEEYGTTSIRLEEIALGDTEGEARFHVSSGQPPGHESDDWDYGNKSSSLLAPAQTLDRHTWLRFDDSIVVPVTTLAAYAAIREIEHIDLLHLDVQGAELKVLAGAGPALDTVSAVWMEVEAVPLYSGQPLQADIESFMTERGFIKVKDTVDDVSGDHLYIQPAFFARGLRAKLWIRRVARSRARWLSPMARRLKSSRRDQSRTART